MTVEAMMEFIGAACIIPDDRHEMWSYVIRYTAYVKSIKDQIKDTPNSRILRDALIRNETVLQEYTIRHERCDDSLSWLRVLCEAKHITHTGNLQDLVRRIYKHLNVTLPLEFVMDFTTVICGYPWNRTVAHRAALNAIVIYNSVCGDRSRPTGDKELESFLVEKMCECNATKQMVILLDNPLYRLIRYCRERKIDSRGGRSELFQRIYQAYVTEEVGKKRARKSGEVDEPPSKRQKIN